MVKSPHKLVAIFALFACGSLQAQQTENIIVVQGVGEVTINNTEGRINASVSTLNQDADVALSSNNAIVSNIVNELIGVGISTDDISTNQFNFYPEYDWNDGQRVFEGYAVTNGVSIKVKEVAAMGAVLNLLVDAGASRITSVGFGSSNLGEVRKQALKNATEDALAKATILANANGVNLGNVIQVKLASRNSVLDQSTISGSVSPASPVPISPGQNTYVETVSVTYELIK